MPSGVYTRKNSHREAISKSMRGKTPKNFSDMQKLGWEANKKRVDEKNHMWKGEQASYWVKHIWITKKLGNVKLCDICGKTNSKKYVWHNKNGKYLRKLEDWQRLCSSCHIKLHRKNWVHPKGCHCFRCDKNQLSKAQATRSQLRSNYPKEGV